MSRDLRGVTERRFLQAVYKYRLFPEYEVCILLCVYAGISFQKPPGPEFRDLWFLSQVLQQRVQFQSPYINLARVKCLTYIVTEGRRWKRQFKTNGNQAFPGKGHMTPEKEEL